MTTEYFHLTSYLAIIWNYHCLLPHYHTRILISKYSYTCILARWKWSLLIISLSLTDFSPPSGEGWCLPLATHLAKSHVTLFAFDLLGSIWLTTEAKGAWTGWQLQIYSSQNVGLAATQKHCKSLNKRFTFITFIGEFYLNSNFYK